MKRAIYAGSFDIIHNGHISIIERAINLFPTRKITIIVANNRNKNHMFSAEKRMAIVKASLDHLSDKVEIIMYDGIVSDWANKHSADIMIRGLRDGNDLTYEFSLEQFTRGTSNMETIYLSPYTQHLNTSSSLLRMFIQTNNLDKVKNYISEEGFNTLYKILKDRV